MVPKAPVPAIVPRFLIRDRDAIYGEDSRQRIKHIGIEEVSQNASQVGSVEHDHVIQTLATG